MILPKGEFIGIYRGKPLEYVDRVSKGYLKISWKDSNDIYLGYLVVENGRVVMGELEFIRSKKSVKGKDAFEIISNIDYAVIEVYSVDPRGLQSIYSMNDESYRVEVEKEEVEEEVKKEEKEEIEKVIETRNFEDFILNIKDFSGIVKGMGEDRTATIYVKDGKIVGAKVSLNGEEFGGASALYYLDFPAKVVMKELNDVNVDENIKVELTLDKSEIIKKYDIKPPDEEEIREFLSALEELKVEEGRFFDKFKKIFKKKK